MFGFAYAFFRIQNAIMKGGIRPPAEMEIAGMDMPEMGAMGYPDFLEIDPIVLGAGSGSPTTETPVEDVPEPV